MTENMQTASVDPIEVVRRHSLTALVRDEIERHITEGALAPGDKLNEADWATRLQVSRGPVREAFRALEQAGLVRTEKNRGVFVRTVSLAEADEIYAVRAVLEEAACRMLAARIDAPRLAGLREWLDAMREALDANDHDAYTRANVAFHDAIVAGSGNLKLYETYRRLVSELSLFRRAALVVHADAMERSLAEHRAILTALASRDAEHAAALMHAHVNGGLQRAHAACETAAPLGVVQVLPASND
ncbi:phosphonate utilization associated transcriptional regulator [Paraburkholderia ginsengiterrae]|uniref:Phosphonate utilization associated transcriptional regulator n=1 Tax=Paraburkholderia ginsengiterrae TaxID=1462993 RepID=A0A1A9N2L7_9BURK|nr:phosphonate utilization associated transcriptional regulator [Paraburkholderia ginsengiterrae]OAJ54707.1 phosphonate utilization associated transcriptional regulator [Paraburkholderia ginsengiterrae]OAJ62547.1 phosphonate utilization associated transcriptional regulator [Paraburkholderia ginsengiterrae]